MNSTRAQHVVVATRFARFACSVLLWLLPLATRFAPFTCSVLLRPLATLFARFACSGQRCSAAWPELSVTHTHTRHRCLFFISKDVLYCSGHGNPVTRLAAPGPQGTGHAAVGKQTTHALEHAGRIGTT